MLAFWLGGVVCYIGHEMYEGESLDVETVLGGVLWPLTIALSFILGPPRYTR
jgi:hypothetical protein